MSQIYEQLIIYTKIDNFFCSILLDILLFLSLAYDKDTLCRILSNNKMFFIYQNDRIFL